MKDKFGNVARLNHILDAIAEIEQYTLEINLEIFLKNSMMQSACIRQLEVIGEASRHITDEVKEQFGEIEWREITDLRNVLIHEYFGVDLNIVWTIIKSDLPPFKAKIKNLLQNI